MQALDIVKVGRNDRGAKPDEAVSQPWCFKAASRSKVDAFWRAGLAAGGTDDGPPGLRYDHAACCSALLRDPDGNKARRSATGDR